MTIADLRDKVAQHPNDAQAHYDLTIALLGVQDPRGAEPHARDLIRLAPGASEAHRLMGLVFTFTSRAVAGEYHIRQAIDLAGASPQLWSDLGWSLREQGRLGESRAAYEMAALGAPDLLPVLYGRSWVEMSDRKPDVALPFILRGRALAPPDDTEFRDLHADALEQQGELEAALAILQDGPPSTLNLSHKGRLLDRLGRYDAAFTAFGEAKQHALLKKQPYRQAEAEALAAASKTFFTRAQMARLRPAEVRTDLPQPIFIAGFPRSGTTMVEQMLSLSPHITAGDELPFVLQLTHELPKLLNSTQPYPTGLADLWMGDKRQAMDRLRDEYLHRCRESRVFTAESVRFTDKMPLNEVQLGFIHLLFPQAPVIHLIRHPLDVVLSVYSHNMGHGFDCDTSIEAIAHHYLLAADLVAHYRREMDLRYLAVRYEDLVDRQSETVQHMMAFLGEPFDPAMLRFERNPRRPRTPSAPQVAETLHRRSLHRYRHYLPQLRPVIPMLRPVMEAWGYTVDEEVLAHHG